MNHMDQMDNMAEAVTEHEKINIESLKEVGTFRVEGPDIPNFVGHTTPGLIFVLFGLKCMFNQFYRYFLCLKEEDSGRKHPRKYENSFLFGIARFPGVPVDSIAALVGSTVGFTGKYFFIIAYNSVRTSSYLTRFHNRSSKIFCTNIHFQVCGYESDFGEIYFLF